jgi:hypothetical protein
MTDLELPTTLYISFAHFGAHGIGNAGDCQADKDRAYDAWNDAESRGYPARAFELEFDFATNSPETFRDVTDDFRAERERLMRERGIWQEAGE